MLQGNTSRNVDRRQEAGIEARAFSRWPRSCNRMGGSERTPDSAIRRVGRKAVDLDNKSEVSPRGNLA